MRIEIFPSGATSLPSRRSLNSRAARRHESPFDGRYRSSGRDRPSYMSGPRSSSRTSSSWPGPQPKSCIGQEPQSRAPLFVLTWGKSGKGGSHDIVEASSPRTEKHRTKAQKSKSVWTRKVNASSLDEAASKAFENPRGSCKRGSAIERRSVRRDTELQHAHGGCCNRLLDRDLVLGLVSFEQEGLYEIDAALKRIEDGTYGVCELTGKAIPWERLEAIPRTRFSIEAENQIEGNVHPHIGLIGRIRMGETELSGTGQNGLADDEVDSRVDLALPSIRREIRFRAPTGSDDDQPIGE
jgi:RNA polymerase-binding transcription factor DksA